MGRPIKIDDEALSECLKVRLTKSEKELIKKRAENANHNVSSYIREAVLKGSVRPIDKVKPQLLAELGRVGNNLNQLAHKVNANNSGLRLNAREYRIIEEMRNILKDVSEVFVK